MEYREVRRNPNLHLGRARFRLYLDRGSVDDERKAQGVPPAVRWLYPLAPVPRCYTVNLEENGFEPRRDI